tara:strand:+ start:1214 stop:2653 length:1440 start_codon:yes stop_codon:yes gene_type:complete
MGLLDSLQGMGTSFSNYMNNLDDQTGGLLTRLSKPQAQGNLIGAASLLGGEGMAKSFELRNKVMQNALVNQQYKKQKEGIAQLEKQFANNPKMLALLRSNPQGFMSSYTSSLLTPKVSSGFQSLHQRALAAGLDPKSKEYRDFMLTGGKSSTSSTFEALKLRAKEAGLPEGSDEYKAFMLTAGKDKSLSQTEMMLLMQRPDLLEKYFQNKFGDEQPQTNQEQPLATGEENEGDTAQGKEIKYVNPVIGKPELEQITYTDGTNEIRPKVGTKLHREGLERIGKAQVQFKNLGNKFNLIDDQIREAEELIKNQTLKSRVTGNIGVGMSNMRGTNAYKFFQILESIRAKIGFEELKKIKMEGATLGSVTEQEFRNLATSIVALDQGLDDQTLLKNLQTLRESLNTSKNTIQEALLIEHPKLADNLDVTTSESQEGKIDLPNPTTITRDELAAIIGDDFSGLDKLTDNDLRIIQGRILTGKLN